MKIIEIDVHPFSIKMQRGKEMTVTYGTISDVTNIAVRILTDEQYEGWGEASCSTSMFYFNGETQASVRAAIKNLVPQIIGQDPLNLNAIHDSITLVPRNQAKCAIDIALHDLVGKKLGLPVYRLLGGNLLREAPMSYTVGIASPKEMATAAVRLVEEGFRTLEVKVGRYQGRVSLEDDFARVKAVRDAVGNDIILIVDANVGWNLRQAIQVINRIEGLDVLVEQPVRYLEGLREVKKKTSVPIIADESCQGIQDLVRIIELEAADIISVKIMKFAGFYESMRIMSICDAFGLDYRYDNMTQTNLGATASLHLTLAHRMGIPSGGTSFLKYEKDLVRGGVKVHRGIGTLENPEAPGLGITVNNEILATPDVYKA